MSGDGMLTKMYKIVLALMDMKDAGRFFHPSRCTVLPYGG